MSYSHLPTEDETSTSSPASQASAFPPGYDDDLESGGRSQNYVHLSTDEHLITTLNVDTDLAPMFGRFVDEEEQTKASNVVLRGNFVNVTVRLQGRTKAKIEMNGSSLHRRVLQIESTTRGPTTPFAIQVQHQGRNTVIVVPDAYGGAVGGYITLSANLSRRATCLVKDDKEVNKTRYFISPPATTSNSKKYGPTQDEEGYISSVTNTMKSSNHEFYGKCYVCTAEEYLLDEAEMVSKEREHALKIANSGALVQFYDYWGRLYTYGSTGEKVGLSILACIPFIMFMAGFIAILVHYFG